MQVAVNDFIKSPGLYLEKAIIEAIHIIQDGQIIAVLSKPSATPVSDSLLGLLSGTGIKDKGDIKAMRTGV